MNRRGVGWMCVAVVVVGCAPGDDASAADVQPTTYSTIADNEHVVPGYPPVADRWDVVAAITDPGDREAAQFAAETASMFRSARLSDEGADLYKRRVRRGIAAVESYGGYAGAEPPQTGGETFRAADAVRSADGSVTVTVCRYNTPGIYWGFPGQDLFLNPEKLDVAKFEAKRLVVERTTIEDAKRDESDEPRLLVTSISTEPSPSAYEKCNPHLPEPFVVAPPERLPGPR